LIPWIQVYSNLVSHAKTAHLADLLKLTSKDTSPNVVAAGMLVSLWTWAIQNAYNGDLSTCSDRTIADAARYKRKPEALVKALIASGWLDADRQLHDWEEYTLLLIKRMDRQKEQSRERVQRYRNKSATSTKPESNAPCNVTETQHNALCNGYCNVTVTKCNASTLPEPLPIPLPSLNNSAPNTGDGKGTSQEAPAPFDRKSFTRFWEAYPVKIDRDGAWSAWCTLRPDSATAGEIISALAVWKKSGGWTDDSGRYIPQAAKFLSKGYWKSPPSPAATATSTERRYDPDEEAAMRQMLEEAP